MISLEQRRILRVHGLVFSERELTFTRVPYNVKQAQPSHGTEGHTLFQYLIYALFSSGSE